MGLYDTFGPEGIQIKAGLCDMNHYNVGDKVEALKDGIYIGYEGIVVIQKEKVVAIFETDNIFDKWGGHLDIDLGEKNPISNAVREIEKTRGEND